MDAFGIVPAGRRDRCELNKFLLKVGGTSGLGADLERAKVGEAEGP